MVPHVPVCSNNYPSRPLRFYITRNIPLKSGCISNLRWGNEVVSAAFCVYSELISKIVQVKAWSQQIRERHSFGWKIYLFSTAMVRSRRYNIPKADELSLTSNSCKSQVLSFICFPARNMSNHLNKLALFSTNNLPRLAEDQSGLSYFRQNSDLHL
jgi:hypothetical protein